MSEEEVLAQIKVELKSFLELYKTLIEEMDPGKEKPQLLIIAKVIENMNNLKIVKIEDYFVKLNIIRDIALRYERGLEDYAYKTVKDIINQ